MYVGEFLWPCSNLWGESPAKCAPTGKKFANSPTFWRLEPEKVGSPWTSGVLLGRIRGFLPILKFDS
jgi:hypothetical protein